MSEVIEIDRALPSATPAERGADPTRAVAVGLGQGRLLPSAGVDPYAATLGKWFGISDADLLAVLPNLANDSACRRNPRFV
jgi:hypothetical protein